MTFMNRNGIWITNWGQFANLNDINWEEVYEYTKNSDNLGFGYYYGHNSRNLTSKKNRVVIWRKRDE